MLTPLSKTHDQTFTPTGKTFRQRLDAMIDDARKRYGIEVHTDPGRTPEWQQRMHICHMFLYNAYQSTTPAHHDPGKRTIAWSHLSNAAITWELIPYSDILRTKSNAAPKKSGTTWAAGFEPDRDATEKQAKSLLQTAGIGNQGKAMISSGLHPCGEPCRCHAGRSKHLADSAADLNMHDMAKLESKLKAAKAGTIDDYLKTFGLYRPLLHHPSSPERWHVEATP
jgi:hypothetical protein